jgi:hypothetical protein
VKVEIPTFAADIFDPGGGDLVDAVAGCRATAATWDTMEDWQRQQFGMYRWPKFESLGYEEEPRTRV